MAGKGEEFMRWYQMGRRARFSLSLGASVVAMGVQPAAAQNDPASSASEPADQDLDQAPADAGSIVVTGSRIRSDGMQAPVPVTVVSADSIEALSPGALITGLGQLPQFYGNQTAASGAGVSFFNRSSYGSLNLRGLGVNRTLTLLNGRRMPSSSAYGGVDVNMIPEAMITNVEITTGGASAAYGSDAVAGVVNFTLDTNFTGLEMSAQGGITDRGDGENYELSATYGMDLGTRGHVIVSGEYFNQKGIFDFAGRDWYQSWGTLGAGTADNPYRFSPNVISSHTSFDGIIVSPDAAINGLAFDSNGNVAPFDRGSTSQGAVGGIGARHVAQGGTSGEDLGGEVNSLVPDLDRYSFFAYADYEVTDNVRVFAQYIHSRTQTFQYSTPRAAFHGIPTALTIFQDNAYLPDSLRQTMVDNDIESFTLRRFGSIEDIGQVSLDDTTTQHIATAGFAAELDTGGFLDGWNVDGFYQYGRSERDWRQLGLRLDRVFAAADAVRDGDGNIVCRVSTFAAGAAAFPGCQPLNLLGRGNASADAVDYVIGSEPGQTVTTPVYFAGSGFTPGQEETFVSNATKDNITTFTQNFAELSASGEVIEGWAGPISLALGGSWRRDHIRQIVHDVTNPSGDPGARPVLCNDAALGLRGVSFPDCNSPNGVQYSRVSNILGSSDVWEAFSEVLVPLVDTDRFTATANGAVRWADYSGSGTVWAYKGGLELGFIDAVRLRGTYSRDVRAANLAERFDQTGGVASILDPRYPGDGIVPVNRLSGGNPAVRPEKADTMTLGLVFQPGFAPGLSASLDFYRIKISDAISQVGNQVVVDRCELEDAQEFCALITRDPVTDRITQVGDVFVNVAQSEVSGLDAEVNYSLFDLLTGSDALSARLFTSWLFERSETNSSGVTTNLAGQIGARQSDGLFFPYADFKATMSLNYQLSGVSALLQGRYIGGGVHDATLEEGVTIVDNSVDDVLYVDLRLGYAFEIAGADAEVFVNATNLFDADPPLTPSYNNFLAHSTQYNIGLYDVMGRRYTAGVKLKF
jgi:outer membrane receptor protein involved in Fe transport